MSVKSLSRFVRLLALGVSLGVLPTCVEQVPLDDLPCPCAAGWVCCSNRDICVREGVSCSSRELAITPAAPRVRFGGTLALTASESVSWSLEEGEAAGSIDPSGIYHAPLRRGPFHVIATSLRRPAQQIRAEVTVGPSRLELLAGHTGGYGFADGPGVDARFGRFSEVVGDGQKILYVLDTGNQAVRKIDLPSGEVSTLMRSPRSDGQLTHLTYDAKLGLFALWETKNRLTPDEDQLLAIDPATGATRASEAVLHKDLYVGHHISYYNTRTVGVAALGDYVYELGERQIFRRPVTGGTWELAAGAATPGSDDGVGASVRFAALQAMIQDGKGAFLLLDCVASGPVWVSDPPDVCNLRTYAPDSMAVKTVNSWSPVQGLHRIASDSKYYFITSKQSLASSGVAYRFGYWNDDSYYSVRASLDAVWAQNNHVYIADAENAVIRRVGPLLYGGVGAFTNVTTIAGARPYQGALEGVGSDARLAAPKVLAADDAGGVLLYGVWRIDARGRLSRVGSLAMDALVFDRGKYVYTNSRQNCVATFDPQSGDGETIVGSYVNSAGNRDGVGYDAEFNQPSGIATDGMGNFYVADTGNGAVRKVVLATKTTTTLATGLGTPLTVAVGDGEIFVADKRSVRRVRIDSGAVATLSSSSDGWKQISALAYDPAGILYVSDIDDSRVRAIVVGSGEIFDLVGQSGVASVRLAALPAGINTPSGLALLPSGELVISSSAENSVLIAR